MYGLKSSTGVFVTFKYVRLKVTFCNTTLPRNVLPVSFHSIDVMPQISTSHVTVKQRREKRGNCVRDEATAGEKGKLVSHKFKETGSHSFTGRYSSLIGAFVIKEVS